MSKNAYKRISGAATTLVKTGSGTLHNIVINRTIASATITVYDGVDATGTLFALITAPATLLSDGPVTATYDCQFSTGLCIVTTGSNLDLTVTFE
jgi:hypothetical protein